MKYIQRVDYSLCDGVGVIAAGWAWGRRLRRLNGRCCSWSAADTGWRTDGGTLFYGGKEGVAEMMAQKLKRQFDGLIVAGTFCPPFHALSAEEEARIVGKIRATRPDVVWVGLGLLKQERWIASRLETLDVPWVCGVGAAFDHHSSAVPGAPAWLRALGLEWLFRWIIQPRLLAKRHWWSLIFVHESFRRRFSHALRPTV